jgi:predicted RNA-binding Zn ribbon-like protein
MIDETGAARLARKCGAKALDALAADARELREWAREWLSRWRERPQADYREELATLNKRLAAGTAHHEVVKGAGGELTLAERPTVDTPEALLALLAMQVATLLTQEQPALVKSCAGQKCSLWFVDRTKAHRRLFCSATACGNRAKVAAFRERQRSE